MIYFCYIGDVCSPQRRSLADYTPSREVQVGGRSTFGRFSGRRRSSYDPKAAPSPLSFQPSSALSTSRSLTPPLCSHPPLLLPPSPQESVLRSLRGLSHCAPVFVFVRSFVARNAPSAPSLNAAPPPTFSFVKNNLHSHVSPGDLALRPAKQGRCRHVRRGTEGTFDTVRVLRVDSDGQDFWSFLFGERERERERKVAVRQPLCM